MYTDKDAILAAATGYPPEKIRLFVHSLHQTNFSGVLVLIIYKEQEKYYREYFSCERNFIIEYQITTMGRLQVNSQYTGLLRFKLIRLIVVLYYNFKIRNKNLEKKFQALSVNSYPHVARFFEYKKFLDKHQSISKVLLTDVRDVFFQRNPFDHLEYGLYVGMENPEYCIANEKFNKKWILDAYGEIIYEQLKVKQISCSGVTLGDCRSVSIYINKMVAEFMAQPYAKMSNRIYDQAMHNKLIGFDELNNLKICQPFESMIVTLGLFRSNHIIIKDGYVVNRDNSHISIVHQYDRHPELFNKIK